MKHEIKLPKTEPNKDRNKSLLAKSPRCKRQLQMIDSNLPQSGQSYNAEIANSGERQRKYCHHGKDYVTQLMFTVVM